MNTTQKKTFIIALSMLVVGLLGGYLIFGNSGSDEAELHSHDAGIEGIWTCSMHPQIQQNEPGKCPICGMDLIPLETSTNSSLDPNAISMSPTAMQLSNVQTQIVGSSEAKKQLNLNGKIQVDERLLYTQATHIPGRIEQLMVNFTGEYINKGQTIALVYSPELSVAQEELLQAAKIKSTQPQLYEAAVKKLKNWKITEDQISEILSTGKPIQQFPIKANVSGFVTEKLANLGDHLGIGQPIYKVSDLSRVWVLFDVYESDLAWIKKGDEIEYRISSLPGETFKGKITFLDPVIDPATRVAKARVEMANPKQKLKPEMFVSGTLNSILDTNTTGLTIPKSAVLWTGKRSVVYVKSPFDQQSSFSLREVTLGPALGESYLVEDGLEPGEEVVINGAFSIDAAAQLAGKPSMMNPEGGKMGVGHNHSDQANDSSSTPVEISGEAKNALKPLFEAYLSFKNALAQDDFQKSKDAANQMKKAIDQVDMKLFTGEAHTSWMEYESGINLGLAQADKSQKIEVLRKAFQLISIEMVSLTEQFQAYEGKIYVQHCPMADSFKGADWLSLDSAIINPYFGASMLTCGEVTKSFN
ncbi:efflux RND transporter periplasmic adaptor subunit [Algoriphagus sp. CAU 1675]|uniref:efflux RND transporter periplasmic adaptor subunit n=1 Tax=Algoriphagus sp. CAU 1675 TaxID=3032597 RepID=UPI0023DC3D56|nr:efflux RND transporter periplasmic adaptor subunit [Algoriphagus sp. CAU 1675]MDF2157644.1 efflux RND transporter periplasmic adaptor subunit [Algoriphagus sp. CAU 1675]